MDQSGILTWRIPPKHMPLFINFYPGRAFCSDPFLVNGIKWYLKCFPNGLPLCDNKNINNGYNNPNTNLNLNNGHIDDIQHSEVPLSAADADADVMEFADFYLILAALPEHMFNVTVMFSLKIVSTNINYYAVHMFGRNKNTREFEFPSNLLSRLKLQSMVDFTLDLRMEIIALNFYSCVSKSSMSFYQAFEMYDRLQYEWVFDGNALLELSCASLKKRFGSDMFGNAFIMECFPIEIEIEKEDEKNGGGSDGGTDDSDDADDADDADGDADADEDDLYQIEKYLILTLVLMRLPKNVSKIDIDLSMKCIGIISDELNGDRNHNTSDCSSHEMEIGFEHKRMSLISEYLRVLHDTTNHANMSAKQLECNSYYPWKETTMKMDVLKNINNHQNGIKFQLKFQIENVYDSEDRIVPRYHWYKYLKIVSDADSAQIQPPQPQRSSRRKEREQNRAPPPLSPLSKTSGLCNGHNSNKKKKNTLVNHFPQSNGHRPNRKSNNRNNVDIGSIVDDVLLNMRVKDARQERDADVVIANNSKKKSTSTYAAQPRDIFLEPEVLLSDASILSSDSLHSPLHALRLSKLENENRSLRQEMEKLKTQMQQMMRIGNNNTRDNGNTSASTVVQTQGQSQEIHGNSHGSNGGGGRGTNFKSFFVHYFAEFVSDYYEVFVHEGVADIPLFLELTNAELTDIGVKKLGHRKAFLNRMQQIKQQSATAEADTTVAVDID